MDAMGKLRGHLLLLLFIFAVYVSYTALLPSAPKYFNAGLNHAFILVFLGPPSILLWGFNSFTLFAYFLGSVLWGYCVGRAIIKSVYLFWIFGGIVWIFCGIFSLLLSA